MANYEQTEVGVARHAWVNEPDTKYNPDGLYHVDFILEGEAADRLVAKMDALANDMGLRQAAAEKRKIKDWKKWKAETHVPYTIEMDDEGTAPTGRVIFKFKQNVIIPLPDGSQKVFKMGIYDSKGKEIKPAAGIKVFGGDSIKVMWAPRIVPVASSKMFSLRADFCMVQLIKKAERSGQGFDEVEGGYVQGGGDEGGSKDDDGAGY